MKITNQFFFSAQEQSYFCAENTLLKEVIDGIALSVIAHLVTVVSFGFLV